MSTKQQFADYLNKKFLEWQLNRGVPTSMTEWAKWMNVPNTSLSMWMNAVRLPVGDNIYKLADRLGPEVYDLLGLPRHIPRDDYVERMVEWYYDPDVSDEARAQVWDIITGNKKEEANKAEA